MELIYHIITLLSPQNRRALIPASDVTAKTLVAWTRVCRATYVVASEHLWNHCTYIESNKRLERLLDGLRATTVPRGRQGPWNLTSLYLAPFGETLDNLRTALGIRDLFYAAKGTLKRLVIDMPLRSLYPKDDVQNIRAALREGFSLLTALEEFVSIRDELFLDTHGLDWLPEEPVVWTMWPKIHRLALYNPFITPKFWRDVIRMPRLESLVLTRADGLCNESGGAGPGELFRSINRALRVVLVNVSSQRPLRWGWGSMNPKGHLDVVTHDVPTSCSGDENPIELCQNWAKSGAATGDIWTWNGAKLEEGTV